MSRLFRPTRPYILPAGADVVVRAIDKPKRDAEGRIVGEWPHVRLMEKGKAVYYPLSADGRKYLKPARKWYGKYTDADGIEHRDPLSTNRDAARQMLGEITKRVELEKGGVRDPFRSQRKKPLTVHLGVPGPGPHDALLRRIAVTLAHDHGIAHPTVQIEADHAACALEPAHVV